MYVVFKHPLQSIENVYPLKVYNCNPVVIATSPTYVLIECERSILNDNHRNEIANKKEFEFELAVDYIAWRDANFIEPQSLRNKM